MLELRRLGHSPPHSNRASGSSSWRAAPRRGGSASSASRSSCRDLGRQLLHLAVELRDLIVGRGELGLELLVLLLQGGDAAGVGADAPLSALLGAAGIAL